MRACSKERSHDLKEADPWSKVCPICGSALVDVGAGGPIDGDGHGGKINPPAALVCSIDPAHDISRREDGAVLCSVAGCGGKLIQIECQRDWHDDLAGRAPHGATCPRCSSGLVTPVCPRVSSHSMVWRVAGQMACPICGAALRLEIYRPPAEHKRPMPPPVDPETGCSSGSRTTCCCRWPRCWRR